MQYLYYFANTSLVLRLLTYLSQQAGTNLASVTVIYLVDRWIIRIQLKTALLLQQDLDFTAFLNENGSLYTASSRIAQVLRALDGGMSATTVMNHYHIVVVSHGALSPEDLSEFKATFVRGLGYCPPSLV
ncbi:MAG: hypothetical protein AAFY72_12015 [Cyanobacteria bacterium J06649_4]